MAGGENEGDMGSLGGWGAGSTRKDGDEEPYDPSKLFRIKRVSDQNSEWAAKMLLPPLEPLKHMLGEDSGDAGRETGAADESARGEGDAEFALGSSMNSLRGRLAEEFRKAVLAAWSKEADEASRESNLGSLGAAAARLSRDVGTPARSDKDGAKEETHSEGDEEVEREVELGRSRPRSRHRPDSLTAIDDDNDDEPELALVGMLSTGATVDVGETTLRLQRKRYTMRLQARTNAALARNRSRQCWGQRVETCRRSLGTLATIGTFAERCKAEPLLDGGRKQVLVP